MCIADKLSLLQFNWLAVMADGTYVVAGLIATLPYSG